MEKSYRKRTIAVTALSAGFAALAWTATTPSNHHTAKLGSAAPALAPPRAQPTYTAAALFALGTTQEYELDESSSVTTTAGQAISTLELRGAIGLTAVRAHPTVLVRGAFAGAASATVSAGETGPNNALSDAARKPFVLEFASDGRFLRALGAPGVLPIIGRAWTSFGESLQLTRSGAGSTWRSKEQDAAGSYFADYEQRDPFEISKHKAEYDSLVTKQGSYDVLESRAAFTVDDETHLSSFTLTEQTRVTTDGLPGFIGSTKLSLKFARTHIPSGDLDGFLAEAAAATPLVTTMHDQQEEARDRERIGGMSAADVFSGVRAFAKADLTKEERQKAGRAFVAMAAMLRRDPSMLDKVKAHLAAKGPDTTMMLAALRDASTPAAQRVLADMSGAASPLGSPERLEAARSLSRVERPTADTVEALKQLRSDPLVGTQATYGLGSVLHKLKDTDPLLAQNARQALTDELDGATTSYERVATLTALGNAGDASMLDQIRQQMTSDDPAVRGAAAQALRRIPGSDAEALLATLAADPAVAVRYSAVDAIGERAPAAALAEALVPLALNDADFKVRSSAVTTLARWLSDLPILESTLRQVADSDPHRDIRNTANSALAMNARLAQMDKQRPATNKLGATP